MNPLKKARIEAIKKAYIPIDILRKYKVKKNLRTGKIEISTP